MRGAREGDGGRLGAESTGIETVQARNAATFHQIIVTNGWPGRALASENDAEAAWLAEWSQRVGWRPRIMHLTRAEDWDAARAAGTYTADSLSSEGFIHCSEPQQVIGVADARFRGRRDLVLLQIAVVQLTAPVKYENLEGGDDLFPHIYGPLNVDAVIAAAPFLPNADGSFDRKQVSRLYDAVP